MFPVEIHICGNFKSLPLARGALPSTLEFLDTFEVGKQTVREAHPAICLFTG